MKFVLQISGLPATVAHLANSYGKIGVSTNQPKMNQSQNFTTISSTLWKLKGGLFLTENCKIMYLGPHSAGILDKWGCLPISPNKPNFKNFQQFPVKNPNWKGPLFYKKIVYLRPHNAGQFTQIGVSAVHNQNSKRVYFVEKNDISCIQVSTGWAILVKCIPTDRPYMGWSIFLIIVNLKYKKKFGSVLCKKLLWSKIGIVDFSRLAPAQLALAQ